MTRLEKINSMMQEIRDICDKWDLWNFSICLYETIGYEAVKDIMDTYAWQHAKECTRDSQCVVYWEVKYVFEHVKKRAIRLEELAKEPEVTLKYIPSGVVKTYPKSIAETMLKIEGFVVV